MRFKGTTALLALFVILGGYVYFAEYRGKEGRDKQEVAKKKAVNIDEKDITEISLVFPDHTITGVKKGEKQWEVTSPPGIEADSDEWDLLASNVPRIEREDTVTPNATDLAQFGLTEPTVKVAVKTKDGKTTEILFGAENPRKIYNYAKFANSNEVFLSPSSWSRIFQKTVTDLRNKKVLDFAVDDVDSATITAGKSEMEFQKSGSDWLIKKPIDAKGDGNEISAFVNSIKFARASAFAEPTVDPKTAGLEPPSTKITLHDGKTKASHELDIGSSPQTDKYYAKDASRSGIFIIEKDIPEKAKRPLLDWRDKSLGQVDRDKTDLIEIHRGSDVLTMKKDGNDWKLPDGRKLQWDKVSSMMNTFEFDKAKDIIDSPEPLGKYGLDKPKLEVVLKQGANELLRLSFGSDSKTPEGVFAKTTNSPAVKVVDKTVYDSFNMKAEDLLDNTAAKPEKK